MKFWYICALIFILCLLFFSYKLTEVPRGITIDEAAFGYNAALISETLRDENGRFLPVFVLSLDSRDWRQPVAQYADVLSFKLFGRSLFNLKMVSVVVAAFSVVIIYLLGAKLFDKNFGLLVAVIFITTPVIVFLSHLALDNIMPVPFILLWLLGLVLFKKEKTFKYLVLSGFALGVGFYAHKSMRSAAPVWTVLTIIYLALTEIKNRKLLTLKNYKPVLFFLISILPFYIISPILDYKYAGAVFGTQTVSAASVYDFVYYYISNFDLSFLFVKGDTIVHYSTGKHGMFLLSILPLFAYGIYESFRPASRDLKSSHALHDNSFKEKNIFFIFLVICFFTGPLFLGFIGSVHRASRIIFLVPLVCLISAFGFLKFLEMSQKIFKTGMIIFYMVFILNFSDFLKYYWFNYADDTYHIFYSLDGVNAYKKLDEISKKENLTPLISAGLLDTKGDPGAVEDFVRSLYFVSPISFDESTQLPEKSILLSRNENLKAKKTTISTKGYYLYTKN